MFASRPAVHPMEVAAPANPAQQPPGVLMKDLPAMPGTLAGLSLRVMQLLFAAVSLAVMSSTSDFASVSAFCPYGAIYDERFLLPAGALSAYLIIGLIYLKIHAEVLCNLCDGRIISAAKPRRPIQITYAYISNESLGDQGLLRQRGVP